MRNSTNSSWQDNFSISEEDLKKPGFILHLGSLLLAVIWLLFLVFYSSRVYGHLLTKILNKFILSSGYLSLGKFLLGEVLVDIYKMPWTNSSQGAFDILESSLVPFSE